MPHGNTTARPQRRGHDIIVYPESPACVVNVRQKSPDALELCTIFRRGQNAHIASRSRATATIMHTHACKRGGVIAIHARSRRYCRARAKHSADAGLSVVTVPAVVNIAGEKKAYECGEYPVLVLNKGKWMPCMLVDAMLAPEKSEYLCGQSDTRFPGLLSAQSPPESSNAPSAVVLMRNGRIMRVLEYLRTEDTCTERSAVIYSSTLPS